MMKLNHQLNNLNQIPFMIGQKVSYKEYLVVEDYLMMMSQKMKMMMIQILRNFQRADDNINNQILTRLVIFDDFFMGKTSFISSSSSSYSSYLKYGCFKHSLALGLRVESFYNIFVNRSYARGSLSLVI